MTLEIIKLKQILEVEHPRVQTELSQRVETCDIRGFMGQPIPLNSDKITFKGFKIRLCQRKGKKIWVVQEPNCKFYQSFLDHKKYRESQDQCFGICKNMQEPKQRETYGCIFSRKYGIYLPNIQDEEGYIFMKRDWT